MSDSAAVCPHCGERLLSNTGESANTESAEPKKQFDKLTNQEKNALREEFYRAYPAFRIPELKEKRLDKIVSIFWWSCVGIAVILAVLFLYFGFIREELEFGLALGLMIGLPLGVLVLAIVARILIFNFYTVEVLWRQQQVADKKFNVWLEGEKHIMVEIPWDCNPKSKYYDLDSKEIYDAIDPDEEVKKWRL